MLVYFLSKYHFHPNWKKIILVLTVFFLLLVIDSFIHIYIYHLLRYLPRFMVNRLEGIYKKSEAEFSCLFLLYIPTIQNRTRVFCPEPPPVSAPLFSISFDSNFILAGARTKTLESNFTSFFLISHISSFLEKLTSSVFKIHWESEHILASAAAALVWAARVSWVSSPKRHVEVLTPVPVNVAQIIKLRWSQNGWGWVLNLMVSLCEKGEGDLDTETHKKEGHVKMEAERDDAATGHRQPGCPKAGGSRKDSSPEPSGGAWRCQHPHCGRLAS